MDVSELYQDIILEHYRQKSNSGLREPFEAEVHHVNPSCGDEVTLRVHLADDTVADVSYHGDGCSISQASTSVMTELVIGKTLGEAMELYRGFQEMMHSQGKIELDEERYEDAIAFNGVSKIMGRVKCAMLGWSAFVDAAQQATEGQGANR